jgi:hypothetical protein
VYVYLEGELWAKRGEVVATSGVDDEGDISCKKGK